MSVSSRLADWLPGPGACALAAAGGLLAALAFPPWEIWPLALVGALPLLILASRLPPRRAATAGWIWGLFLGVAQFYWISVVLTVYGHLAWPLAALALILMQLIRGAFYGLAAGIISRLVWGGAPLALAAPLAWAGCEWLLGQMPFGGFPWMPWGNALMPEPRLLQSAEWWGVFGISGLLIVINALLAQALAPLWERRRPGWVSAASLAAALVLMAGAWWWGGPRMAALDQRVAAAPGLAVSVIQGNFEQSVLWDPAQRGAVVTRQLSLSRQAAAQRPAGAKPWVVVWSESSAPFYFLSDARHTAMVLQGAARVGGHILVGTMGSQEMGGRPAPTNRTWLVDPQGRPVDYYDKVHLVPFGEYVPWQPLLSFVRALATVGIDFAPGPQGKILKVGQAKLAPLICYESIFPELARAQRLAGAHLIINQTNDAWFGPTAASRQHMGHLVLRCIENRMACARSANTGISGFVDPAGRVWQATDLFTPAFATRILPLLEGTTFYTRWGDLAGWGGLVLAVVLLGITRRRARSHPDIS